MVELNNITKLFYFSEPSTERRRARRSREVIGILRGSSRGSSLKRRRRGGEEGKGAGGGMRSLVRGGRGRRKRK